MYPALLLDMTARLTQMGEIAGSATMFEAGDGIVRSFRGLLGLVDA